MCFGNLKKNKNMLLFVVLAFLILGLWLWQNDPTVQQIFMIDSDDEEGQQQTSGPTGSTQPDGEDEQPPSQDQEQTGDGDGDETPPEQPPPEEEASLTMWFELPSDSGMSLLFVDAEQQFKIVCETNKPGELVVVQVRRRDESWTEACRGPTGVPSGVYECYYLIHTPGFYDFTATLYDSDMEELAEMEIEDFECHGFQLILETHNGLYPYRCDVNEPWYLMIYSCYQSRTILVYFWVDGVKSDGYMSFGTDANGYYRYEGRWSEAHVYEMQAQIKDTIIYSNKVTLTVNP